MTIKRVYTGRNVNVFYQDFLHQFAEIAMSPRILAICLEVADKEAKPIAISLSPVGETGLYIRSWHVFPSTAVVAGMRRVCAKLVNTAPHSALVEWGGGKGNRKYRKRGQHIALETRNILTGRGGHVDPDLAG